MKQTTGKEFNYKHPDGHQPLEPGAETSAAPAPRLDLEYAQWCTEKKRHHDDKIIWWKKQSEDWKAEAERLRRERKTDLEAIWGELQTGLTNQTRARIQEFIAATLAALGREEKP